MLVAHMAVRQLVVRGGYGLWSVLLRVLGVVLLRWWLLLAVLVVEIVQVGCCRQLLHVLLLQHVLLHRQQLLLLLVVRWLWLRGDGQCRQVAHDSIHARRKTQWIGSLRAGVEGSGDGQCRVRRSECRGQLLYVWRVQLLRLKLSCHGECVSRGVYDVLCGVRAVVV